MPEPVLVVQPLPGPPLPSPRPEPAPMPGPTPTPAKQPSSTAYDSGDPNGAASLGIGAAITEIMGAHYPSMTPAEIGAWVFLFVTAAHLAQHAFLMGMDWYSNRNK